MNMFIRQMEDRPNNYKLQTEIKKKQVHQLNNHNTHKTWI